MMYQNFEKFLRVRSAITSNTSFPTLHEVQYGLHIEIILWNISKYISLTPQHWYVRNTLQVWLSVLSCPVCNRPEENQVSWYNMMYDVFVHWYWTEIDTQKCLLLYSLPYELFVLWLWQISIEDIELWLLKILLRLEIIDWSIQREGEEECGEYIRYILRNLIS